jgi:hypothetical protein
MAGLLDALFQNESGGRNVANTTQGTSSGQAQGYFQITTGTWDDFGGRQFAPNPLAATYEQQAAVASKIPLKRWDKSTLAKMSATGKRIDPNLTLGENLAANGESVTANAPTQTKRTSGPVEAAGGGGGNEAGGVAAPQLYTPLPPVIETAPPIVTAEPAKQEPMLRDEDNPWASLASGLGSSVKGGNRAAQQMAFEAASGIAAPPEFESALPAPTPDTAPIATDFAAPGEAPGSELAGLFKVDPAGIGQAAAMNIDKMGNPIRRRTYG